MDKDRLVLYVCETAKPDVEKIIADAGGQFDDIKLVSFPYMCEKPAMKGKTDALIKEYAKSHEHKKMICGRFCPALSMASSDSTLTTQTGLYCSDYLVGSDMIQYITSKGGYIISAGWLKNWRLHLEATGFTRELAQQFYQEICKELVFLDVLKSSKYQEQLAELGEYLQLPYTTITVAPDLLISTLQSMVMEFRFEKEKKKSQQKIAEIQTHNAEYAALLEVLRHIASFTSVGEAVAKVQELYSMLFGAQHYSYTRQAEVDDQTPELIRQLMDQADQEYLLNKEEGNILLKVVYKDVVYGVFEIGNFLFPQYIDKYLNFGIEIARICGLVFANNEQFQRLQESERQAEEASLAKGRFLANMSHEIRTPLNGILGMMQLLEFTSLSQEQKEFLNSARRSSELLQRVIDDILEYSRLDAGMVVLEKDDFSLKEIVKDVHNLFIAKIEEKSLDFSWNIKSNVPDQLHGDHYRIKQILINLAGNALKFTDQGKIWIDVSFKGPDLQGRSKLLFEVGDTGIGIPEDKIEGLFSFFEQADPSFTRKYGGSGLGLAISKGLVEQMEGSIWADSKPNRGSVFFFILPLEHAKQHLYGTLVADPEEKQDSDVDSDQHISLLIAEDDETSRVIIQKIAQRRGWNVTLAENGKQAVDLFDEQPFDLVILDIQMPEMDGLTASRLIRDIEKDRACKTPILAMTAHALRGDREKCLEAGMDDYLTKPIQVKEFYAAVEKYAKKNRK